MLMRPCKAPRRASLLWDVQGEDRAWHGHPATVEPSQRTGEQPGMLGPEARREGGRAASRAPYIAWVVWVRPVTAGTH